MFAVGRRRSEYKEPGLVIGFIDLEHKYKIFRVLKGRMIWKDNKSREWSQIQAVPDTGHSPKNHTRVVIIIVWCSPAVLMCLCGGWRVCCVRSISRNSSEIIQGTQAFQSRFHPSTGTHSKPPNRLPSNANAGSTKPSGMVWVSPARRCWTFLETRALLNLHTPFHQGAEVVWAPIPGVRMPALVPLGDSLGPRSARSNSLAVHPTRRM